MRNTEKLRDYFLGKDPQLKETMADNSLRLIGIDGKHFVLRKELLDRLAWLKATIDKEDLVLLKKIEDLETAVAVADTRMDRIDRNILDNTAAIGALNTWKENTDFVLADDLTEALSDYYDKEEVNELISLIPKMHIEIVEELPTQDISTETFYLVPSSDPETRNVYDEYIYVIPPGELIGQWELIGTTDIDLTNYYTKAEMDTALGAKENVSNKVTSITSSSTNTEYPTAKAVYDSLPTEFTGTTGSTAGTKGLVPAPTIADANKYLKSDGTWVANEPANVDTIPIQDIIDLFN